MTGEETRSLWGSYEDAFVRDVHRLIAWGYADASAGIRAEHEEEDITGMIVEAIQERLDHTGGKFNRYFVKEAAPVRGSGRRGKRRMELDIEVECSFAIPRLHFIFEAERLRTNGYPIGKYTGDQGLLCFIRGEYASGYRFAGMIGYVQSHTPDRWFQQLFKKFKADTGGILGIVRGLSRIAVDQELQNEWVSEHQRIDGSRIAVYHILLICH